MKRTVWCLLWLLPVLATAQVDKVNSLTELRSRVGVAGNNAVVVLLGTATLNDGNGDMFYWSPTDTQADNGMTVIKVAGVATGSWIRLKILNSKTNTFTGTVGLAQTTFVVTHNLGVVPSFVTYAPKSDAASGQSWEDKTQRTATTFTVVYKGTLTLNASVVFDWLVRL